MSNARDLADSAQVINILDGITTSTAELNYTDGVTSAIQTQLDSKQPADSNLTSFLSALNLPTSDGTEGQVIATNGGGTLSFVDGSDPNALTSSDIGSTVQAYDSNLTSFITAFTLPTSDGTDGQVLVTNGAGTLSLETITIDGGTP